MSRPSTIYGLPAEAREALEGWLRDPGMTKAEAARRVNALLADLGLGELRVSRHAVHRYDLLMRTSGERKLQLRQVAETWVDKLGSAPIEQVVHLVTEMLSTLTFELALRLLERELDHESMPALIEAADKVSLIALRLERSSEIAVRREHEIKRQAAEERSAKAAGKTKSVTPPSSERLREIIRIIYGVELGDRLSPAPLHAHPETRDTKHGL